MTDLQIEILQIEMLPMAILQIEMLPMAIAQSDLGMDSALNQSPYLNQC
jgi:hypothetical protein